ncbi:MAG: S-layer homology domain-containing protein [Clostridia bacterium]|nr:S-layer homology domain-containing protein [Clostridia bacterium]
MKKLLALLMAVLMTVGSFTVCMAESTDETEYAYVLYKLGLFSGTGTDEEGNPVFGLENKLSRQEAAVLLVRLLGKETEAKNNVLEIPFTDVADWAKPYVSYAYNNGLVNGIGETSFGSGNPISATEYLTLVLRALGHDDKNGDFTWNAAWVLSDSLGMTEGQYTEETNALFTRKDAALIFRNALYQKIKGGEDTLVSKLFAEGVFSKEQLESTGESSLLKAAGLIAEPSASESVKTVAPVTGVTFEQRGVYVKMTLTEPEDKTGIVSYEALIFNKNNPEIAVHRSIALDNATAYYRLDNPGIFVPGNEYNAIKVIANGAEGYAPAYWESDIAITPTEKDIEITGAWVVNDDEIDLNLVGTDKGYMGFIFTRKDGTVVDEDTFFNHNGTTAKYRANLKNWSDEDKKALENGEISVAVTGMYIEKMTDDAGSWMIIFDRIKAPKVTVKCEVDIVK